jgi:hypothetical protein
MGDVGIARVLAGLLAELGNLRKVVIGMSGEAMESPAMVPETETIECQHYFGWLEIDPGDRSPTRGHNPMTTVKCANCGKTWPSCAELLVVMKGEMEKMWIVVRKYAGRLGVTE